RLQLVTAILTLSPLIAVALWFSAREPDLNRRAAALGGAASEGRRLAFILVGLTIVAASVGPTLRVVEGRLHVGSKARRAIGGLLVTALLVAAGIGLVEYGGPQHLAS